MVSYNEIVTFLHSFAMRNPVHVIANPAAGGMWQSLWKRDHHGLLRSPRDDKFVIESSPSAQSAIRRGTGLPGGGFSFANARRNFALIITSKEARFPFFQTNEKPLRLRAFSAEPLPLRLAPVSAKATPGLCKGKIQSFGTSIRPCGSEIKVHGGNGWKTLVEYLHKKPTQSESRLFDMSMVATF